MKILVSWLREFVDVSDPAPALASRLSACGFEVAGIEGDGDDAVIDFEITANRPDCLSVLGLAREASTAYDLSLKLLPIAPGARREEAGFSPAGQAAPGPATVSTDGLSVTIEAPDLCPRYAAAIAEVKVAPSPGWLAARLEAAGVRPINNVVDVTNYVLLEMGHPMHAFDLERLAGGQLRARRARAAERVRTLDGADRALEGDMLVIADAESAQAVAGVMGGAPSEVWSGSRLVAFESAYFKPASVRRTSKRLGLKTEASSRFERGTDIAAPVAALERALALLEQIGAGRRRGEVLDCYPAPRGPVTVTLRRARIGHLLGLGVEDPVVERIFSRLEMPAARTAEGWDVTVPTFRVDVSREADLIEELARHVGYDRIPATFPPLREMPARPDPAITRKALLRHILTAAGYSEAISFTFIETPAAEPFLVQAGGPPVELVPLAYPLSEKFAVLRPSLLPGLLDAVAHNRRRESRDARLFEIGSCFDTARGEGRRIAWACTGSAGGEHWSAGDRPVDFFDVKGVVERVGEALRLPLAVETATRPYLVPGRTAQLSSGGLVVGVLGQLLPALAAARDMPAGDEVYVAELDLDALNRLVPGEDVKAEALPRFPSIVRDISILVDEGLPSERVRATIRAAAPGTLARVREFDRYQGKGIPEGRYSLSLRLTFRSPERTLTDAEVQAAMDAVIFALVREHGAIQR